MLPKIMICHQIPDRLNCLAVLVMEAMNAIMIKNGVKTTIVIDNINFMECYPVFGCEVWWNFWKKCL
jgi:hypothetical protein